MSFKISNSVKCLAALALVSACSSPSGGDNSDNSGNNNNQGSITSFDSNTSASPVARTDTTTTGTFPTNTVTGAKYDETTDKLTLTRSDGSNLDMTGEVASNGDISGYTLGGSATTPVTGAAIVAQTSGGAGYAVALYDNATAISSDPEVSVLVGGDPSTTPTQSAIASATFTGQYVGFARITDADVPKFTEGNVIGDASLSINSNGDGFEAGDLITNRQSAVGNVENITTTGGAIDGNMLFTGGLNTSDLLGETATGAVAGGFFDASSSNSKGEAIGAIVMTGVANCTTSGNIRAPGSVCVVETGTFVAAPE